MTRHGSSRIWIMRVRSLKRDGLPLTSRTPSRRTLLMTCQSAKDIGCSTQATEGLALLSTDGRPHPCLHGRVAVPSRSFRSGPRLTGAGVAPYAIQPSPRASFRCRSSLNSNHSVLHASYNVASSRAFFPEWKDAPACFGIESKRESDKAGWCGFGLVFGVRVEDYRDFHLGL